MVKFFALLLALVSSVQAFGKPRVLSLCMRILARGRRGYSRPSHSIRLKSAEPPLLGDIYAVEWMLGRPEALTCARNGRWLVLAVPRFGSQGARSPATRLSMSGEGIFGEYQIRGKAVPKKVSSLAARGRKGGVDKRGAVHKGSTSLGTRQSLKF
jgi:hypothetical protein